MNDLIELEECPCCRGAGMLMHEGGWNVQVECVDCSAHTVYLEYENEEQKGYTPFLDSLMRQSYTFYNMYANGKRSIQALPSVPSKSERMLFSREHVLTVYILQTLKRIRMQ